MRFTFGVRWRLMFGSLGLMLAVPLCAAAQTEQVRVTTPIIIPSGPGAASPYPLNIPVSGVVGYVVPQIRLKGLRHTWPTDLDILLVTPSGERIMLMSDVEAGPVNGVDLTFMNGAPLPPTTLVSGTYRPSDRFPGDSLPGPAPAAPYTTSLPLLVSPNGTWQLYVADDAGGDAGSIDSVEFWFTFRGDGGLMNTPIDNGTVDIPLTIGGVTGPISSIRVGLAITHPAVGELNLYLVAPDGTAVEMSTGNGGAGANYGGTISICSQPTTFSDSATLSILESTPPFEGTFRPEQPFWSLAGTNASGVWKIRIVDTSPGNAGFIRCGYMFLTGEGPTTVNDTFSTPFQSALSVGAPGVLANDIPNLGGDALTAALVSGPAHGTVTMSPAGGFSYLPFPGFTGADTFTYRALNEAGTGTTATVSVAVQQPTAVQAPFGLFAWSIEGNGVTLRWTPPLIGPPPTSYVLEGGVQPGETLAAYSTGSGLPVFAFTAPTGSFHVRIRSVGAGGEISSPSNELPIHVGTPVPPSAPGGLTAVVYGSSLGLAWRQTFEGGAATALILNVSGSANTAIPLASSNAASFTNVPPGSYTLSLQSVNAAGVSPLSNAVTVTLPGPCSGPPQPPAGFLAYRSGSVVTVVWDAASSGSAPTAYVLNVSGAFVGSLPLSGRSISAPVGPGSYTVSLFATNACGTSALTTPQTIVVP